MSAFGPLFRHELTRLARCGLQPKLRAAFAGLLLVALLVTYLQSFPGASAAGVLTSIGQPLTIEAAANFAERFLISFLVVQLLVVCVVTPVVAGGAIAEERDRGTLDFLLSSPLTNSEIVLGKMAARLAFMAGLLLTGLPVLVLTMFFGGVDGAQLLAGYAITLATVFSMGALSLWLVVRGDTFGTVLLRVYMWQIGLAVFGFCCGCCLVPVFVSPFAMLFVMFSGWEGMLGRNSPAAFGWLIGGYAGLHLFFGVWWLARAVERVRRSPVEARQNQWPPDAYNPPRDDDLPPLPLPQREYSGVLPSPVTPVGDGDPFAWKERWFGPRVLPPLDSAFFTGLVLLTVVLGLLFVFGVVISRDSHLGSTFVRVSIAAPLLLTVCGCGVVACHSVAGERLKGTLVPLLSLPAERWDVLLAKVRHAGRVSLPLLVGVVLMTMAAMATETVSPVAAYAMPLTALGWYAFALGAGVWMSVRAATPGRAAGLFLGALLALTVFPPLFSPLFESAERFLDGLSPVVGVWNAVPYEDRIGAALGSVSGAVVAAVAGWLFWRAAVREFETIGE